MFSPQWKTSIQGTQNKETKMDNKTKLEKYNTLTNLYSPVLIN